MFGNFALHDNEPVKTTLTSRIGSRSQFVRQVCELIDAIHRKVTPILADLDVRENRRWAVSEGIANRRNRIAVVLEVTDLARSTIQNVKMVQICRRGLIPSTLGRCRF